MFRPSARHLGFELDAIAGQSKLSLVCSESIGADPFTLHMRDGQAGTQKACSILGVTSKFTHKTKKLQSFQQTPKKVTWNVDRPSADHFDVMICSYHRLCQIPDTKVHANNPHAFLDRTNPRIIESLPSISHRISAR